MSGLYLITPDGWSAGRLHSVLKPLLRAGIAMLQYRDKSASASERLVKAQLLVSLCRQYQTPLIINDDVRLARLVRADGVHLGGNDNDPRLTREQLGHDAIIGCSCYNDLTRAELMQSQGADYLAFGSMFTSPTKPATARCSPQVLQQARVIGVPVVAIGGINLDNAGQVLKAGADMLAVISDVFGSANPEQRLHGYQRLFAAAQS